MEKCLAKDRNAESCRNHSITDSRFCKFHQYMNEYTEEMLENLTLCNGCKKMYCLEKDCKTCDNCRNRGKKNRVKTREEVVLCEKEGCKFKKSEENKYCMKHQIWLFVDETKEKNKKMCANYLRGCRVQLDLEYAFTRCDECRSNEREKDKEKRKMTRETNENMPNSQTRLCNTCNKELDLTYFVGVKSESTKTCSNCREQNRIQDAKRDKDHRNELARLAEAKPERKAVKQEWVENNYDKVALKWMNYRHRKIETLGVEEFLKKNNEYSKNWRDKNPEKCVEINENRKNSKQSQYNIYKNGAENRNITFTISFEEYCNLVEQPCYYCGIIQDKGFNGIDKRYPSDGYILENCVSCCKVCNFTKGALSDDVFIKRVHHILTYQNIVNGTLFPESFANHISGSYKVYQCGAIERNLEFEISEDVYNETISQCCYLCGKQNTILHRNGIDRVNNKIGYKPDNIKPCCGECNFMKKELDIEILLEKYKLIYKKHKNDFVTNEVNLDVVNDTKKTNENGTKTQNNIMIKYQSKESKEKLRESLKEKNRLKKQRQRERLKEKYGDEEYKRMRAKEIADYRSSKKERTEA